MDNNPYFDLYIDEGTTFEMVIKVTDVTFDPSTGAETEVVVDLTSIASVSAMIKPDFLSASSPIVTFSSGVLGDATKGEVFISLTSEQTKNLATSKSPVVQIGYYDIILTKTTGTKVKLVGGKVFINQSVSV